MPSAPTQSRPAARRFAAALSVLAVALGIALAGGASSSAQSQRLHVVRAEQDQIRAELAQQNAAVDTLLGQVGELRSQERKLAAERARQEARLTAARDDQIEARAALAETKRRLSEARVDLKHLLISIYRYGQIDTVNVLLNADGFDDLVTRSVYLQHIRDYESGIVARVRDLRAEASAQVDAMEGAVARIERARAAIAARQEGLAASRASLEEREAALRAAQDDRREQLSKLQGRERSLVEALSTPAPAPADPGEPADGDSSTPPATAAPAPSNGSTATLNSDGTATAPADAPQAVKDVIAAANAITNAPYVYGGGHGSFDSSGYDCSGSLSYALHGAGLLSSPLDSTGFMTWGDPGPGNWITVYSNPGHAYAVIAGLRFDTSGAPPRWQTEPRDPAGYVATHPPGY